MPCFNITVPNIDSRKVVASFFDNEHCDDPWAEICCNPKAEEGRVRP